MGDPKFPADLERQSAGRQRYWRRRLAIAVLCAAAAAGLYTASPKHRARPLSDWAEEFEHSPGCEFRVSKTSLTCRGIAISDEIAQSIASARTITALDFFACRISSDAINSITSLPNLSSLSMVDCQLTGAGNIRFGTSQSLLQVTLRKTKLAGSNLARFLSEQPHLETLILDKNDLTDSDLEGWTASPELTHAVIQEPGLKRTALAGLRHCQSLEMLSLASSGLDDDALADVARLTSLRSLDLTNCPALDGSGLGHVAPLNDLSCLYLSGTSVTDRGLQSLRGGFLELSEVKLADCSRITDAALESLAQLPRLRMLDLTGTKVTGRGLRFFDGHKLLGALILGKTQLDDVGLATLSSLPALTSLDLSHTQLAGGAISRLKNCPRLETLSIAGCSVGRQAVRTLSSATPAIQFLDCSGCSEIDDETIEALRSLPRLRQVQCDGTRVFDSLNRFGVIRMMRSNGFETVRTNAEIDEAAAIDLSHGGMLRVLTLDHCQLSANALKIATSSPALRVLTLNGCTIRENKAGQLGPLNRLESLTIRNTAVDPADIGRVCCGRRLSQLALEGPSITQAAFSGWTGAPSAESIEIRKAHFGGTRLRGFQGCTQLQSLDLRNSDATDAMLEDIQRLAGKDQPGSLQAGYRPRTEVPNGASRVVFVGSERDWHNRSRARGLLTDSPATVLRPVNDEPRRAGAEVRQAVQEPGSFEPCRNQAHGPFDRRDRVSAVTSGSIHCQYRHSRLRPGASLQNEPNQDS